MIEAEHDDNKALFNEKREKLIPRLRDVSISENNPQY
jgi:hypothetical protein